jgi:hypothetical protein
MTLDRQEIRETVCRAIALTLQRSGREAPKVKDSDKPVDGYEGFDSQCGVEVTLELEQLLGIDDLGTNIFVTGVGKSTRARKISEIVDCVCQELSNGGGA